MSAKDDVTLKYEEVAKGVEDALRRQFGSAAEVQRLDARDDMVVFGITVDGYDYFVNVLVAE
jgi:hypothetical protein